MDQRYVEWNNGAGEQCILTRNIKGCTNLWPPFFPSPLCCGTQDDRWWRHSCSFNSTSLRSFMVHENHMLLCLSSNLAFTNLLLIVWCWQELSYWLLTELSDWTVLTVKCIACVQMCSVLYVQSEISASIDIFQETVHLHVYWCIFIIQRVSHILTMFRHTTNLLGPYSSKGNRVFGLRNLN